MTTEFPRTINELFNNVIAQRDKEKVLLSKQSGQWRAMSSRELADEVKAVTAGLNSLDVNAGDRIGILSENRPEWVISDLGILCAGAVDVPIYTTLPAQQAAFLVSDSDVKIIFVSNADQRAKIESVFDQLPNLKMIISFDAATEDERHLNYATLLEEGREALKKDGSLFQRLSSKASPDDLATLIYTSGTTGEPKGVMLTHGNLISNVRNTIGIFGVHGDDVAISYLPLSHIFERAVFYNYLYLGVTIAFAESIDRLAKNLQEVCPTFMTSVPRFFEKVYSGIQEKMAAAAFPKKQIGSWGVEVGKEYARRINNREHVGPWLKLRYKIADRLVFKMWRAFFGGRLRTAVSGGAALPPDIGFAFLAAGIEILQGYGLTETTAGISTNTVKYNRIGTVGKIIPGIQVKLASDGEILVKGTSVTSGYYNRPEANAESFDAEGWFRTGDIGVLDGDGFLTITDRKKDLIKTSGGKYIAPQPIENMIKASRFVSQVVVVGDGRKFASALIVPNMESLQSYAKLKGIECSSDVELVNNQRIVNLIERQVTKLTPDLARYETIKRIALLDHELTIDGGEMTPTLKVKRRFVEQKYKEIIDQLYNETDHYQERTGAFQEV